MKKLGNALWGIVLIALGVILGLNATGVAHINIFFDGWWTLFIIIPCFIGLIRDNDKVGNLIGLLIGVALLLCCQRVLNFDMIWKLLFPAILVIIGLSLIFKDAIGSKVTAEIKNLNKNRSKENEYCATFGGQNINLEGQEFKGLDLSAVFGGIKCDLTKAKITGNQVINVSTIFGGADIFVPNNVRVIVKSTPIFGGVSDKTVKPSDENAPIIYVNATCVFGGVDIK